MHTSSSSCFHLQDRFVEGLQKVFVFRIFPRSTLLEVAVDGEYQDTLHLVIQKGCAPTARVYALWISDGEGMGAVQLVHVVHCRLVGTSTS